MIDPKQFATELRIGNWLNPSEPEYKGKYFQIDAGDIKHIRDGMRTYKYEPIPLSGEVLQNNLGFTKHDASNEYFTFWELPNGWHIAESHHDEPSAGVKKGLFYWGDNYHEVKHLHKLMNLYFELNDKELIYNPSK